MRSRNNKYWWEMRNKTGPRNRCERRENTDVNTLGQIKTWNTGEQGIRQEKDKDRTCKSKHDTWGQLFIIKQVKMIMILFFFSKVTLQQKNIQSNDKASLMKHRSSWDRSHRVRNLVQSRVGCGYSQLNFTETQNHDMTKLSCSTFTLWSFWESVEITWWWLRAGMIRSMSV